MRVFSWGGAIDTTMSPLDSIRYHKSFLRTGFMSMDAHRSCGKPMWVVSIIMISSMIW